MIKEAFVAAFIVALIRRGNLRNLEKIPLRYGYLFILSFVLAGAVLTFIPGDNPRLLAYAKLTNIFQYVVLMAVIGINRHVRGMLIVGAGALLNAIVLTANGGLMPVSMKALRSSGLPDSLMENAVRHVVISPETRLVVLSDIIPIRLFGNISSQVISIGDVVISVGIFLLIQYYMCHTSEVKEPATSG